MVPSNGLGVQVGGLMWVDTVAGVPLQVNAVLPTIPWQTPFLLIAVGIIMLFAGVLSGLGTAVIPEWNRVPSGLRVVIVILVAVGVISGTLPALFKRNLIVFYALYLMVLGRLLAGSVAVHSIVKMVVFISGSTTTVRQKGVRATVSDSVQTASPSGKSSGTETGREQRGDLLSKVVSKLKDRAVRIILTSVVSVVMLATILVAVVNNPLGVALRLVAITVMVGQLGITTVSTIYVTKDLVTRFGRAESWSGLIAVVGLVFTIAGAAVFDFPAFAGVISFPQHLLQSPTGEFFTRFAGSLGFLAGGVLSLGILVLSVPGRR